MRLRLAVLALVVLGSLLSLRWVQAQALAVDPVPPRVMTGSDLGFRVEGLRGDKPVGTIVVRVDGQWVEAELGGMARPIR